MTMFGVSWALKVSQITPTAKLVAIRIGDYCDENGRGQFEITDLAEWCCCQPGDIYEALKVLDAALDVRWHPVGIGEIVYQLPHGALPLSRERKSGPEPVLTLYVFSGRPGVKIGITGDLNQRVAGLRQAMLDDDVRVEWHTKGPASVVRKAERYAHQQLIEKLIRNEWFACSVEEAIAAANHAFQEFRKIGAA